jgi:hypothetical protein
MQSPREESSTPEESNTITIARPVSDLFAFLADAENDTQWRGGVIEITRTSGQGVGTTYRQIDDARHHRNRVFAPNGLASCVTDPEQQCAG